MATELPPELIRVAREYCREAGEFSIDGITQANPAWADRLSYHCDGDSPEDLEGTYDAHALMGALEDEFEFTEDGWDSFLADARE